MMLRISVTRCAQIYCSTIAPRVLHSPRVAVLVELEQLWSTPDLAFQSPALPARSRDVTIQVRTGSGQVSAGTGQSGRCPSSGPGIHTGFGGREALRLRRYGLVGLIDSPTRAVFLSRRLCPRGRRFAPFSTCDDAAALERHRVGASAGESPGAFRGACSHTPGQSSPNALVVPPCPGTRVRRTHGEKRECCTKVMRMWWASAERYGRVEQFKDHFLGPESGSPVS
jgi:hypothetical protein